MSNTVNAILDRAIQIYKAMNPYDEGEQRRYAVVQAVKEAGISKPNRVLAAAQVLKAWSRQEEDAEAKLVKLATAQYMRELEAEDIVRRAEKEKATIKAAEQAIIRAETNRRRAIGAEIADLSGLASNYFFGTYSGRGEIVAEKNGVEIVVCIRVKETTSESGSEFGKYVAWGCPLESSTVSFWEVTPEGESILADWKAGNKQ
jgi:hypothetical protein